MSLMIADNETVRWAAMGEDEKQHYLDMANYLNKEYGSDEVSLADVDSAIAIGA